MFGTQLLPRSLAAALRDIHAKRWEVRLSALADLVPLAQGETYAPALGGVLQLLHDPAPRVRGAAALALADLDAQVALPALLELAAREERTRVLQLLLVALGELAEPGPGPALELVRWALQAEQPELRYQGLIAYRRLAPAEAAAALSLALADPDAEVRYIALRLGEELWAAPGAEPLPEALSQRLLRMLQDAAQPVRLAAAILLGRRGDARGAEVLCEAVAQGAQQPEDEQAAIELCAELALESALPELERRAFGWSWRSSGALAWQARVALARLGHREARRSLLGGLKAWSRQARTLAVVGVGRAGVQEAQAELRKMRADPRRAEPAAVAEALAQLARLRACSISHDDPSA